MRLYLPTTMFQDIVAINLSSRLYEAANFYNFLSLLFQIVIFALFNNRKSQLNKTKIVIQK